MKFKVNRISDWGEGWEVEINTLEELITFYRSHQGDKDFNGLIISRDNNEKDEDKGFEIQIFDDYL